jgi:hypothetical protein
MNCYELTNRRDKEKIDFEILLCNKKIIIFFSFAFFLSSNSIFCASIPIFVQKYDDTSDVVERAAFERVVNNRFSDGSGRRARQQALSDKCNSFVVLEHIKLIVNDH